MNEPRGYTTPDDEEGQAMCTCGHNEYAHSYFGPTESDPCRLCDCDQWTPATEDQ